ncbi:MAG: hypothetical protein JSR17_10405 [Proteobacteria bacterium]|nr:hypothetical protein [Pseudomonadota bacterium]
MNFEVILYNAIDNGKPTQRKISSIYGFPFYCSSGNNSSFADTWFPFFGIEEQNCPFWKRGYFLKPISSNLIPKEVRDIITELFKEQSKELLSRFCTLPCIIISSHLGGGIWETQNGLKFKQYLSSKYPLAFQNTEKPEFVVLTSYNENQIEQVNEWLALKANVKSQKELSSKFPYKLEDLFAVENKRPNSLIFSAVKELSFDFIDQAQSTPQVTTPKTISATV